MQKKYICNEMYYFCIPDNCALTPIWRVTYWI